MEWDLQQLGFDHCYDKRLYDRLLHDGAGAVHGHLQADLGYQHGLIRFVENHDEPRAASVMSRPEQIAAAVMIATLPGATLWHEGQFDGWRVRLPVFLGRRPIEPSDAAMRELHLRLIAAAPAIRQGDWSLCWASGWDGDQSCAQLVSWCWRDDSTRSLVVINLADAPAHGPGARAVDGRRRPHVAPRGRAQRRRLRARRRRPGGRGALRRPRTVGPPRAAVDRVTHAGAG